MSVQRNKIRRESRTHNREIHQRPVNERDIGSLEDYISRKNSVSDNPIDIPKEWIPHGWTYNWFASSQYGKEDVNNIPRRMQLGWYPVPWSRHPQLCPVMPDGSIPTGNIKINELELYEKPTKFVEYDENEYRKKEWMKLLQVESINSEKGAEFFPGLKLGNIRKKISYEEFGPEGPKMYEGGRTRTSNVMQGNPYDGFGF